MQLLRVKLPKNGYLRAMNIVVGKKIPQSQKE